MALAMLPIYPAAGHNSTTMAGKSASALWIDDEFVLGLGTAELAGLWHGDAASFTAICYTFGTRSASGVVSFFYLLDLYCADPTADADGFAGPHMISLAGRITGTTGLMRGRFGACSEDSASCPFVEERTHDIECGAELADLTDGRDVFRPYLEALRDMAPKGVDPVLAVIDTAPDGKITLTCAVDAPVPTP